ncbi:transcription factor [Glomus cerebriforme]|uniref:Transcription factor n=1 Tax=Glomus cerebriforme TaxID=658196 RepID=A0A397T1A7_9GLOM|nr:transcription factor [Glomus cerebriforme]
MAYSKAIVKCILSGDTLILRGRPSGNQPPPERQLNLAFIQAPRLGNQKKEDEPFAFEAREYLRNFLVGKEVAFRVEYTIPNTGREYGTVLLGSENVTQMVVKEGWAKVREDGRKNKEESRGEEIETLIALESEAKSAGKGVWQNQEQYSRSVNYTLQEETREYLDKYKGLVIEGIIEQVRDGSSLRVLFIPPSPASHQYLNINISGIKAPIVRKDVSDGGEALVEPFGEEAKYFVETRILQKNVKVILEGLSGNQAFYASILHPAGNIAEALLSSGLAKVADRSITMVTDGPTKLRAAENIAKEKQLRLWKDHVARNKASGDNHEFEATVTRIISGDTISVKHNRTGIERKLQLSSIRQPKPKDSKFPEYNFEAKEFLRKKLIGKAVKVTIDYSKPATDGFEAKDCATVRIGEFNAAEALLERGLAHIIRHKRDDEDRSSFYDQLMIAEQKAQTNAKGIHSPKDPPVYRISDASENVSKAKQFLNSLQRAGRIPGVIDYVYNASRFKIFIPRESYKITFVLGGIRAPRPGRNPSDKSDPFAIEASEFATRKTFQRDVEIEVENVDKTGGFIGTLWIKNENFAVALLREGFATIHDYSASQSPYSKQLYAAEENAKTEKKNIWSLQDNESFKEQEVTTTTELEPRKEYVDIVVTEFISGGRFYLQVINDDIHKLEKMMSEFSLYHKNDASSSSSFTPRNNEMVSAQFTEDNRWYRAKIKKVLPESKNVEVIYTDYGNSEVIPLTRVRPLPDNFKQLPSQSQEAILSFLNVRNKEEEYGEDAYEHFRDIVGNKRLVANIDYKENNLLHLTLYDPKVSQAIEASINAEMVKAGYATVDKKSILYKSNPAVVEKLLEAQEQAKKGRMGMFEYGDITADDE